MADTEEDVDLEIEDVLTSGEAVDPALMNPCLLDSGEIGHGALAEWPLLCADFDSFSSFTSKFNFQPTALPPSLFSSLAHPSLSHDTIGMDAEHTLPALPSNAPTLTHQTPDIGDVVRKLATLNVELYQHNSTLPPTSSSRTDRTPSAEGRIFAIDETFRLTQSLIDTLRILYPSVGQANPEFVPDQGTLLLIMSCSTRVFDIYEVIFAHMRGCIQHSLTPVTPDGNTIRLPPLRIGSFAPPTPSAIAMHMLLVIIMASQLFDHLQEVLGSWHRSRAGSEARVPGFTNEAAAEMVNRARNVAGEILAARQMVLGIPGLQLPVEKALPASVQPP